ncbi:hypothetical protein ACLOJK_006595 [Asimina triloba]
MAPLAAVPTAGCYIPQLASLAVQPTKPIPFNHLPQIIGSTLSKSMAAESNRIRQKNPFGHSVHERKLCTVNRYAVATNINAIGPKEYNRIRQNNPFGHFIHEGKLCTVNRNAIEREQKCYAEIESATESATTILLALCNVYIEQISDRICRESRATYVVGQISLG